MADQERPEDSTNSFGSNTATTPARRFTAARDTVTNKTQDANDSANQHASTSTSHREKDQSGTATSNQAPFPGNICKEPDELDAAAATQGAESTGPSGNQLVPTSEVRVADDLTLEAPLLHAQDGHAYFVVTGSGNPQCFRVGSRQCDNLLRRLAHRKDRVLLRRELRDINEHLQSVAEMEGASGRAWSRIAPVDGGIEIDLGDDRNTRVRITSAGVETVTEGSPTLFYRTPFSRPMAVPAEKGELGRLDKHLNLDPIDILLLKAWISYTLAHPKMATTKYVTLLIQGEQGTGKTFLCNVIQALIDPNEIDVQILPTNGKDLAIAAQNAHVLAYDNVRGFRQSMADLLCIASTGGALSSRQLYTDADQAVQRLHVAMILNGIHDFVNQPDLAQRCLPIHLKPLAPEHRRSEKEIMDDFNAELPVILRGLLDLIADVFAHLPSAEITNPERMIDFVRWLAAMEKADNAPAATYQAAYSYALQQVQRDALLESPLAAAVLAFTERLKTAQWSGTPSELLEQLDLAAAPGTTNWRYWPDNPIALSKRLKPLLGGLREQGVDIQTSRGKERQITITRMKGFFDHE